MADSGTTSEDYGRAYFESYAGGDYHDGSVHWEQFFGEIADRLVSLFQPKSVLDAGCAKGLLVEAFVERDVAAVGIDLSDHAIADASNTTRDRLTVGSLTAPIEGHFDLITCIEVLEHMSPADGEIALDNLVAATDLVIFSSTPRHFEEPTHVSVKQPAEWAARFAERGFFRRIDIDLDFLSPWAVAFERRSMVQRDVVFAYESLLWPLRDEVTEKRRALLETERLLSIESDKASGFDELAGEVEHRQTVIDELAGEAAHRQTVIDELAGEAAHRQVVIDELAGDAEHRQVVIDDLEGEVAQQRVALDDALKWKKWLPFSGRTARRDGA